MKTIWIIILLHLSLIGQNYAQTQVAEELNFVKDLSWKQIMQKAKVEKRYIFIDAYTTWCFPCKKMDMEVFSQKKVIDFFNKNFINVKIQMDITKNDSEFVKLWYADAKDISDTYNIISYPTFLVFDSQGEIVERFENFTEADELIAKVAAIKGPYFSQQVEFENGKRDQDFLLKLIKSAQLRNDREFIPLVVNSYLSTQKDLLTEENIKLISIGTSKTVDVGFQTLLDHFKKTDEILGKGNSAKIIERALFREIALPFLRTDPRVIDPGGNMIIYSGKVKDIVDWKGLKAKLDLAAPHFSKNIMVTSKFHYYEDREEWKKYLDVALENEVIIDPEILNSVVLNIFNNYDDKTCLKDAALISKRLVSLDNKKPNYLYVYSNILYKSGEHKEAIKVFEDYLNDTTDSTGNLAKLLDKMKNGQKTW